MRAVGLRTRVTTVFALGALALSVALAGATYEFVRAVLLDDRESAAIRAASLDGSLVRQGLAGEEPDIALVLRNLDTGETRRPLVRSGGAWFARTADDRLAPAVSPALQGLVEAGDPALQRVRVEGEPVLVVGVPLQEGASYYELTSLEELRRTLRLLATVLGVLALVTTVAGAAVGRGVSRRVLRPLGDVAHTAGSIASGDLGARVARDSDPDLDRLAVAFNAMVDEVSARSAADRRFAADVSHELRSPLQTLSAATSVLDRRRDELDSRTGAAVDLLTAEVTRFEQLVTDLLELARADKPADRRPTDVVALTRSVAASRGLPPEVVQVSGDDALLDVDPRRYEQLVVNLVDNAANHGGGAVRIGVDVSPEALVLEVDDEGPGVPTDERALVFDRFARGRAASARGGTEGTGLGLAIVAQHVSAHRGTVEILDRTGGGARFRVVLPAGQDDGAGP